MNIFMKTTMLSLMVLLGAAASANAQKSTAAPVIQTAPIAPANSAAANRNWNSPATGNNKTQITGQNGNNGIVNNAGAVPNNPNVVSPNNPYGNAIPNVPDQTAPNNSFNTGPNKNFNTGPNNANNTGTAPINGNNNPAMVNNGNGGNLNNGVLPNNGVNGGNGVVPNNGFNNSVNNGVNNGTPNIGLVPNNGTTVIAPGGGFNTVNNLNPNGTVNQPYPSPASRTYNNANNISVVPGSAAVPSNGLQYSGTNNWAGALKPNPNSPAGAYGTNGYNRSAATNYLRSPTNATGVLPR